MASARQNYGAENRQNERYRLSFTTGALLLPQGRELASFFLNTADESALQQLKGLPEIGSAITTIREQAVDNNIFGLQSLSSNKRYIAETMKRLSTLSLQELELLTADSTLPSNRRMLMWIAMCRYYAFVGDFATEVLRQHYLLDELTITFDDYARFVHHRTLWHPELDQLTTATAKKLRTSLFSALTEADLLTRSDHTIQPVLITPQFSEILAQRPESFDFLPVRHTPITD